MQLTSQHIVMSLGGASLKSDLDRFGDQTRREHTKTGVLSSASNISKGSFEMCKLCNQASESHTAQISPHKDGFQLVPAAVVTFFYSFQMFLIGAIV